MSLGSLGRTLEKQSPCLFHVQQGQQMNLVGVLLQTEDPEREVGCLSQALMGDSAGWALKR